MERVTFFSNPINKDSIDLIKKNPCHPLGRMEFSSYFTCFLVIMEQRKLETCWVIVLPEERKAVVGQIIFVDSWVKLLCVLIYRLFSC